jgi:hypothetical protein
MSFRPARNRAQHRATRSLRHIVWTVVSLALMTTLMLLAGDLAGKGASTAQLLDMNRTTQANPASGHGQKSDPAARHHAREGRDPARVSRSGQRTAPRVLMAKRDAAQTTRSAERVRWNQPGYCLNWARIRAHIPARYPDAATAWRHASDKQRGDRTPPAGAAVYWTGGSQGYGHIAISVGHGRVRSTDAGGEGRVATVPVGWPVRHWGLNYAGWSDSINGYTIPGVGKDHRHHRRGHGHQDRLRGHGRGHQRGQA